MGIDDYFESRKRVRCLSPVIDEQSEILILGSVPGSLSLARKEYYANPSNHFWTLIQKLYHNNQPFESYSEKIACLKYSHIALWDVIKSCWRKGSRDDKIRDPECNDIGNLLRKYPNIKRIVLNGRMAEKNFYSSCPISIPVLVATSTSGRSDKIKDKALSKFFCNFELLFEWERCLVGYIYE